MLFEIILIFFLTIVDFLLIARRNSNFKAFFWVISLFRLILLVYQARNFNVPMSGSDWGVFHNFAQDIMAQDSNVLSILFLNSGALFDRIVAAMYTVFGVHRELMVLFSYIMSQIAFIFIYKMVYLLSKNDECSSVSAMIFYAWPLEMVFSLAYLREMTIQCFVAMSLYFFVLYLKRNNKVDFIVACLLAFVSAQLHSGNIVILMFYIAALFLYNVRTNRFAITPIKVGLVIVVCVALYLSGLLDSGLSRFNGVDSASDIYDAGGAGLANTSYISAPGSLLGAIIQAPLRLVYYLISPLPWQVISFSTAIAFVIDGMLRFVVVYYIIKNIKELKQLDVTERCLFFLFLALWLMFDFVYCWGTDNYGTAMRHRLKIFPVEIILMHVYRFKINEKKATLGNVL